MGSSQKRLAWLGAWSAALLLVTALVSASGAASAGKAWRAPSGTLSAKSANSILSTTTTTATKKSLHTLQGHQLTKPAAPSIMLYNQYDNDLNNGIVSAVRDDQPSLSAET